MKIESIALFRVAMPLICPFRTAYGDADVIESVLVKMTSGDSVGWGEATPWASPMYSPEWAAGVYIMIRDWLVPQLLGQDVESDEQLQARLAGFKGNPFAKAGLDLAWWDLQAKLMEKPLWQLVGSVTDTVEVMGCFGVMETIEGLLKAIEGAVQAGFQRVKLKFRPGWDLPMVKAVRRAFPTIGFHVDCNSAYRLCDHQMFEALDEYNLTMIEQPLAYDDLLDHAKLQKMIKTPICLDESITSPDKARKAIEIGACRWINVKPDRVGGITPALEVIRVAEKARIPCWIGGMGESAVGVAHCLALAMLPNIKYPCDLTVSSSFFKKDLAEPEIKLSGPSRITAFPGPGIGCAPEPSRLAAQTIESCQLGPP